LPSESRLAREIKQSKPFTSKATEAAVALMRTADVVRRSVSGIVGRHDLTPQQYNVLRILRGAGEKGLPTLEIADRMIEETPGITRLIDRLESKQLVSRERCLTDRRQVWCRITKSGLGLVAALDEPVRGAEEAALRGFTKKELVLLVELLDQVREGFALSSLNAEKTKEAS
jgi:DNA-binding MarR family transcriptional regulator